MSFCNKKRFVYTSEIHVHIQQTLPSSGEKSFFHLLNNLLLKCKRTSRFALQKETASITIEATVIFSLLLAACMSLLCFVEVFRMENIIFNALTNTARTIGQYGVVYNRGESGAKEILLSAGLQGVSVLAAQEMVINEIGEERLENSFIEDGTEGISFMGSYINGEYINLMVHYNVKFPVLFFRLPAVPITQSCYIRGWSGAVDTADADALDKQIVYITPYGTVYHLSRDCTHLKLSAMKVSYQQMLLLRNSGGGKYYPCEKCGEDVIVNGTVWITNNGDCYHAKRNCSGLKRSVQAVSIDSVGSRSCCSVCKEK